MYYIYKTKKSAYLYVSGLTARGRRVARVGETVVERSTRSPIRWGTAGETPEGGHGTKSLDVWTLSLSIYIYILA